MIKIETLLDTRQEKVPEDSKFLLKFNHGKLCRSNIHDKTYGAVATEAVLEAGQRTATIRARRQRLLRKRRIHMKIQVRLGIPEAEEQFFFRSSWSYVSTNKE